MVDWVWILLSSVLGLMVGVEVSKVFYQQKERRLCQHFNTLIRDLNAALAFSQENFERTRRRVRN